VARAQAPKFFASFFKKEVVPLLSAFRFRWPNPAAADNDPVNEGMAMKKLIAALLFASALSAPAAAQRVLTYHNSQSRAGTYKVPGLTLAAAATLVPDTKFNGAVTGNIYAQPLMWHPKSGPDLLIVATESNSVYALNAATGAVVWQQQLLPSAPLGDLGCGDINPEGVTGAPVIDAATGTLYLDALTVSNGNVRQMIYGLAVATGLVRPGWPLDVQAALASAGYTFSSTHQGERGALLDQEGKIYAVYGGRSGDCDPYNGVVIEVDPATHALAGNWETRALRGGIWSQGGISSTGTQMFITTGNTTGAAGYPYGDGESVVRLTAGLKRSSSPANFYAPANWLTLDKDDADLGGTEALPVNLANGGGKTTAAIIAFGKDGNAYLLNRGNLGGIGGAATIVRVDNGAIITGPAVYPTANGDMVAFTNTNPVGCSGSGIMMITLAPSAAAPISVDWCAAYSGNGAPIITTSDGASNPIVWVTGSDGDNELHGFNALTGATVFSGAGTAMTGLHRYSTLIASDGRLYVAGNNQVYAFTFTH